MPSATLDKLARQPTHDDPVRSERVPVRAPLRGRARRRPCGRRATCRRHRRPAARNPDEGVGPLPFPGIRDLSADSDDYETGAPAPFV